MAKENLGENLRWHMQSVMILMTQWRLKICDLPMFTWKIAVKTICVMHCLAIT